MEEELGLRVSPAAGTLTEVTRGPGAWRGGPHTRRVATIRRIAEDFKDHGTGLSIATNHTQARYALPHVIKPSSRSTEVALHMHQAPDAISDSPRPPPGHSRSDEALELFDTRDAPCYR